MRGCRLIVPNSLMKHALCQTDEIDDPGSMGFEFEHNGEPCNLFVVHHGGQFYGYINSCPHTGVNLEWLENQFLDRDNAFIQCSTHDALFEIDTGACIAGPCAGDSLKKIELLQQNGELFALLDD